MVYKRRMGDPKPVPPEKEFYRNPKPVPPEKEFYRNERNDGKKRKLPVPYDRIQNPDKQKPSPYKDKTGKGQSKAMAARNAAIKSNQRTLSARNMAVDAGKSAYVRGKNAGLVAVPKVMVRPKRRPSDMDPGFNPRERRGVPTPTPGGGRGMPRPTRPRKPGDRRA